MFLLINEKNNYIIMGTLINESTLMSPIVHILFEYQILIAKEILLNEFTIVIKVKFFL